MMTRSDQGTFALVAYVPEPLASFLYKVRKNLSGFPCPQPHITILPPRPLRISFQDACQHAAQVLQTRYPFEVELSRVACFTTTNTLYLDVAEGALEIHRLHDALNQGLLQHQEEFDFRPHLTLAGPVNPLHLTALLHKTEEVWRTTTHSNRFAIAEISGLWQNGADENGSWQRVWSAPLQAFPAKTSAG